MPPYLQLSNEPSLLVQQPLHPNLLHANIPINNNHNCSDHDHDAVSKGVFPESSPGSRFPLTPIPEGIVRFQLPEPKDVHLVPNRGQCLEDGKNAIWYSGDDLKRIHQENRRLLRGYQRKTIRTSSKDFCLRGLERQTCGGGNRTLTNRLSCLYVVLEEQSRQYQNGIFNPELIASLASSKTQHCQKEAVSLGIDDWNQCQDEDQVPTLLAAGRGGDSSVEANALTDFCHFLLNPLKGFV